MPQQLEHYTHFLMWFSTPFLPSTVQLLLHGLGLFTSPHADQNELDLHPQCRAFPGDEAWPTADVWNAFNMSVDGRLIHTVPIGTHCHDPHYDHEKCEYVKKNWHETDMQ